MIMHQVMVRAAVRPDQYHEPGDHDLRVPRVAGGQPAELDLQRAVAALE
jgi:hypothetical protein